MDLSAARDYIPKELDDRLSALFDEYAINKGAGTELGELLEHMSAKYPKCVYEPFKRIYTDMTYLYESPK